MSRPGPPVPLPSCLPSTHPLPGAFFRVSFPAINSQESVPGLEMARQGRKQALMEGLSSIHLSPGRRLFGFLLPLPSFTLLEELAPS